MLATEFRTIRWLLGLEVEEVAEILNVNERTVRRWEHAVNRIPEGIATEMHDLFRRYLAVLQDALHDMEETFNSGQRPPIPALTGPKTARAFVSALYLAGNLLEMNPEFVDVKDTDINSTTKWEPLERDSNEGAEA